MPSHLLKSLLSRWSHKEPPGLSRVCPHCGWPNPQAATTCGRCGADLSAADAPSPVAAELELPPLQIEREVDMAAWLRATQTDTPERYDLRLRAEHLRLPASFDQLICLDDVTIDHYPHQLRAARKALRDMRGRALLADEVGLGKTIEAGIVMKELIERGLAQSVLILTPASLAHQWREEMTNKFHEDFQVITRPDQVVDQTPSIRWLCSFSRARRQRYAERLLAREYDLLIIDEAHKLKNRATLTFKFVDQIRKRYVLMLTATPVHNDLMELYALVTILHPGHLGTARAFKQNFVQGARERSTRPPPHRTVYWPGHEGPVHNSRYPDVYLRASRPKRDQIYAQEFVMNGFWHRRSFDHTILDELAKSGENWPKGAERARLEIVSLLQAGYQVEDFELIECFRTQWQGEVAFVCRLKKPPAPARDRRNLSPKNAPALRRLLSQVMIRNRRDQVSVQLPPRRAATFHLNPSPAERELYQAVTGYVRDEYQQGKNAPHLKLTLATLQREVVSSAQAVGRTLAKMAANPEQSDPVRARLSQLADLAAAVEHNCKVEAVLDILERYPGKLLIFTDYRATQDHLVAELKAAGHAVVSFHGGLSALAKEEAVRAFRRQARVMVSTESGAEGRNLQFCYQMVNYDLPWNPMRIEQRIGRIHRLGQQAEVFIINLAARDTVEEVVLDLLERKIRMFELVIGELDLILGAIEERRSFESLLRDAWLSSLDDAELAQKLAQMEGLIDQARQDYEEIRSTSDMLSDVLTEMDETES